MKNQILSIVFTLSLLMVAVAPAVAQSDETPKATGLAGWSLFLDPGHSARENMGLYNYSEAEKVLRVSLHLRDMLMNQTDIDTVYMTRTNDTQVVGLTQRTQIANATGADFFYSVHSDAGPPNVNSTLMLWGADGNNVEKFPRGGKKMGDIMIIDLTESMRIPTRGSRGDSPFYGAPTTRSTPWLAVNRLTNMASVLSEAGFHTNPTQQMRNLNDDWRKLEAQSAFWSILAYHDVDRLPVGIITGYITNEENGDLLNGATVTIGDQSYTTDTFESLFNQFVSDPDLLANGFYYLEGFEPGSTQEITVTAPDFYSKTLTREVRSDFFSFTDVALVSSRPPFVVSTNPEADEEAFDMRDNIEIEFSRRILQSSLEQAITISPEVDFTWTLENGRTLKISAPDMDFETIYTVSLSEEIEDLAEHLFDGNNDGSEGGTYTLSFKTRGVDLDPPVVVSAYPGVDDGVTSLLPIVSFTLDEPADPSTVSNESITITGPDGVSVPLTVKHYLVGDRSVVQAVPLEPLQQDTPFSAVLEPGIADEHGNAMETATSLEFYTEDILHDYRTIDNFNSGISGWWVPQQSGSTAGIVTEQTSREAETSITNPVTNSTGALALNYGWDLTAGSYLIRNHIPPSASQNSIRINNQQILEAFVFGDGTGNRFRFMLRDGANQLEGSPWYTIDWIGWKLVRWNLADTPAVGWVNGDGTVDGQAYTDSFQLTYTDGAPSSGTFIIDDYRIATPLEGTSVDDDNLASLSAEVQLHGNFPNPFNPTTQIRFSLPERMMVNIEVFDLLGQRVGQVTSRDFDAGSHQVQFDASALSSGVYLYRMATPGHVATGKMMLVK